jgi:hypothetical protein
MEDREQPAGRSALGRIRQESIEENGGGDAGDSDARTTQFVLVNTYYWTNEPSAADPYERPWWW